MADSGNRSGSFSQPGELSHSFATDWMGTYFLGLNPSEKKGQMLESPRGETPEHSMPALGSDHQAQIRGGLGP